MKTLPEGRIDWYMPKPNVKRHIESKKGTGILEVARQAGVSPATVSRVLNGNPTVDAKIQEKVRRTIDRLKYRPHFAARNLPRRLTGNIALATPRSSRVIFSNPFFTRVFEGIGAVIDDSSYNLMFSTTPRQMRRLLDAHTVDGVILISVREDDPYMDELEEMDLPVVVVGAYLRESRFTTLCPDYAGCAVTAVRYLASLGHTKIGHLNGPKASFKSKADRIGFEEGMTMLNLEEVGSLNAEEFVEQAAYASILAHHEAGLDFPTAYVSSSDYLAIGLLKAAADLGIRVPEDLSVIGFGDIPLAALLHPPLTTMHGDLVEMGSEAAQTLIDIVNGVRRTPRRIVYPMRIVERKTTAPPHGGK